MLTPWRLQELACTMVMVAEKHIVACSRGCCNVVNVDAVNVGANLGIISMLAFGNGRRWIDIPLIPRGKYEAG
jgi:hypothetical protein